MSLINTYKKTLKPKGVEECIDLIFYRPLGFLCALFFKFLGFITPTIVSILSGIVGIASGVFISKGYVFLGVLLINLAVILDCSDGQLARMNQSGSPIGRIIDGVIDYICFISLFVGILLFFLSQGYHFVLVFSLTLIAGVSLSLQAASLDYYRNNYLNKNDTIEDLYQDLSDIQKIKSQSSWLVRLICQVYLIYMKTQIASFDKKTFPQVTVEQIKRRRIYGTSTHVFLISVFLLFKRIDLYLIISVIVFNVYMIILNMKKK